MTKHKTFLMAFVCIAVLALASAVASGPETLKGSFVWNNENQAGDVEAVFTGTGEGTWDVSFNFMWEDEPHTWSGTAQGSLTDGALKGEVVTDGERQSTFTFEGAFAGGVFNGTHAQLRDGKSQDTGTLTLGR